MGLFYPGQTPFLEVEHIVQKLLSPGIFPQGTLVLTGL